MLELIPVRPDVTRLWELARNRFWLASGFLQTYSDGSPVFVQCGCGQPAVVITEYIGGKGLTDQVRCLATWSHCRDLQDHEVRLVGEAQRLERDFDAQTPAVDHAPLYSSGASL